MPVDNIINIIDAPQQTVAIPNNIDVNQVDDVVPRFGPGPITQSQRNNNNVNNVDRVRFASEEAAPGIEIDTNFVDDPAPSDFHLR